MRVMSIAVSTLSVARFPFLVRVLTLPISALATVLVSRLIVGNFGVEVFAAYSLIAGITGLFVLADLGTGAAVVDSVARSARADANGLVDRLAKSIRVTCGTGLALAAVVLAVGLAGAWPTLLGLGGVPGANAFTTLGLLVAVLAGPFALSQRALQGAGRSELLVIAQVLAALVTLVWVSLATMVGASATALAVAPGVGYGLSTGFAVILLQFRLAVPVFSAIRAAMKPVNISVAAFSRPMFVISATLPIAFQSDRLVLSLLGGLAFVAQYALVLPLYLAFSTLVAAAGMNLWSAFATDREHRKSPRSVLFAISSLFAAMGLVGGILINLLGPPLTSFMSAGDVSVPRSVFVAFSAQLVAYAAWYPIAMYLTTEMGLRIQARLHVIMVLLNLLLTIALIPWLGAAAPPIGSAISISLALTLPALGIRSLSRVDTPARGRSL